MKESQTHDDGSVRVLGDKTQPFASTLWEAGFTVYSNAKLDTKKPLYGLRWSLLTGGWCSWSGGEPDSEELLLAYETQKNVIQQLQVSLGNNLEQLLTCETQKNVIQQLQVSLSYILEQLLAYMRPRKMSSSSCRSVLVTS